MAFDVPAPTLRGVTSPHAPPAWLSEAGGRRRTTWVLGLLALVFALHDLHARSLHELDTPRWGMLAREMLRTGEWLVPVRYGELYVNKPPLYLWAVAGPSALWGSVTAFLVRLPAALGFVLLVLSTASWARLRLGSEAAARLAGLLALSTFSVAWLAREGRLDMFGAGIATAAAVAWDRAACGMGTKRTPWVAGLWLGAALLAKGPPLLLVPAAVVFAPQAGRRLRARLRDARPHIVLGVGIVVALLWFVPAVLQGGWEAYGRRLLVDQAGERIAGAANHLQPWWFYARTLPLLMLPWGPLYVLALAAWFVPRLRRSLGPAAPMIGAALAVLVVFSLVPTKHIRYLAPLVPLLALGVAWWGESWMRRTDVATSRKGLRMVGTTCLLAAGAAIASAWWNVHPGIVLALSVPVLALLVLGVGAHRVVPDSDESRRRHTLGAGVLAVTALVLLTCTLRYRFRERSKPLFNRALAEVLEPNARVFTKHPVRPEDVFDGAPQALQILDLHRVTSLPEMFEVRAGDYVVTRPEDWDHPWPPREHEVVLPPDGRHRYMLVRIR